MAYYESELAEAMMIAVGDGIPAADVKRDIKVFQESINLLPKYDSPHIMVYMMRKIIEQVQKRHDVYEIMRESFADWDDVILETIKK
jgi:hypothetical protein